MHDAIVFSSWSWEMFNVPERIALAIGMRGARVLYCEMPASKLKGRGGSIGQLGDGVFGFRPKYWGAKLNAFPPARSVQWKMIARQILTEAARKGLKSPLFIYSHVKTIEPLCTAMREHGLPLVHVCMDYPEAYQYEQIAMADRILVIPTTVALKLKAKFGEKVFTIPQVRHEASNGFHAAPKVTETPDDITELRRQGRPILAYLGPLYGRLSIALLRDLLRSRPDWEFVCFGGAASLAVPNARDLPWVAAADLPNYLTSFDAGLMPYDCFEDRNLHCVPLKIFDYFRFGIPVVSTPVLALREFGDLVYLGETWRELERAVERALAEPKNSDKRQRRIDVARSHTTTELGKRLEEILTSPSGRLQSIA